MNQIYGVYCSICDKAFNKPINYNGANFKCNSCRNVHKHVRQLQDDEKKMLNMLKNAESDSNGWSYVIIGEPDDDDFYATYRFKKNGVQCINNETIYIEFIQELREYIDDRLVPWTWRDDIDPDVTYKWLSCPYNEFTFRSYFTILTIGKSPNTKYESAMDFDWGKDIVRNPYRNGLFRFILLRMYILRYIRYLRHITWMPGSKASKVLELEFYENIK
jgi:hypothetical protein